LVKLGSFVESFGDSLATAGVELFRTRFNKNAECFIPEVQTDVVFSQLFFIFDQSIMPSPNSSKASRYSFGSNSSTNRNVGGGERKAGLVPNTNKSYITTLSYRANGLPQSVRTMMFLADGVTPNISTVCASRPLGSDVQFNIYWKCPGLPR
jgi:hypothetical protein